MAYNPFLSMGEPEVPIQSEISNPFMNTEAENIELSTENPFSASNPFADFGESNYTAADPVPVDIFGFGFDSSNLSTNNKDHIENHSPDLGYNISVSKPSDLSLITNLIDHSDENLQPQRPPPARPLSPETQTLILSVTDQMDFNSSHLLDRIPPTRTPSPVSMRDLHSPTFDPEDDRMQESSCLDTQEPEKISDLSEINPFSYKEEVPEISKPKPMRPARPPPAKPPPPARPQPPPIPQLPQKAQPPQIPQQIDQTLEKLSENAQAEVNLFDAPLTASPPKPSKEDILSLYTKKEDKPPVDYLSEDIVESSPISVNNKPVAEISDNQEICSPFSQSHASSRHSSLKDNQIDSHETHLYDAHKSVALEQDDVFDGSNYQVTTETNPFELTSSEVDTKTSIFMGDQNQYQNVFTSSNENFEPSSLIESKTDQYKPKNTIDTKFSNNNNFMSPRLNKDIEEEHVVESVKFPEQQDEFDAFSAKFDSTISHVGSSNAWGDSKAPNVTSEVAGFETDSGFDAFLSMTEAPPAPAVTPARLESPDSEEENFNITIKPKAAGSGYGSDATSGEYGEVPTLAPPPKPNLFVEQSVNPFANVNEYTPSFSEYPRSEVQERKQSGSETPPTPLFDEDVSAPLEEFPRVIYHGPGWEMQLRQPNKKKITGQRYWKKIFVKLANQGDTPVVQLFNTPNDKEPFQELPLQACYSVSDIAAQQYDQYGKIFTVKLQYIFYKERPGVRPGQITKAERITNKLSQFAAYAIQGDYQGVKEFGSDLKKLGLPVEHAPQISQLFKIGSLNYEDVKQFSVCVEEALFKIPVHRDRALQYKFEEVQITAVDELYVEQTFEGSIIKQIARVRLFFLGFLCGMPDLEVGVNDLRRQGKEVVGRHDIIPVATEEWIRVENAEFHSCVQSEEFLKTQILRFKPPDACYVELMRFRIRPPKNRELPLQLKAVMCATGNKVELRADVLVPGFTSRKLGQIPCEDVMIRFPIPECWIYLFRVEKHFRYGSVKSAHRRTGKIKGIERLLGAVDTLQESLIEVTSGQAKYEHQHRAIVWRMPRLPKEGQGAYTTHNLVCRMALTSYDQIPEELSKYAYIEFTMPHTQVSHMTVRSVSLQNHDSDEPPEKYVRYLARHEYVVGIEHTKGSSTAAYVAAAAVPKQPSPIATPAPVPEQSSESDSD